MSLMPFDLSIGLLALYTVCFLPLESRGPLRAYQKSSTTFSISDCKRFYRLQFSSRRVFSKVFITQCGYRINTTLCVIGAQCVCIYISKWLKQSDGEIVNGRELFRGNLEAHQTFQSKPWVMWAGEGNYTHRCAPGSKDISMSKLFSSSRSKRERAVWSSVLIASHTRGWDGAHITYLLTAAPLWSCSARCLPEYISDELRSGQLCSGWHDRNIASSLLLISEIVFPSLYTLSLHI